MTSRFGLEKIIEKVSGLDNMGILELSLADVGSYLEDEEVIQMRDQLPLYT